MEIKKYTSDAILLSSKTENSDGIRISAQLKKFDGENLNGERYAENAYDEFINDYYVKNGYEIPLTVQHGQRYNDIIGVVNKLEKNESGIFVETTIFSNLSSFNDIKTLLNANVLAGLSDEGFAEGYYDEKTGVFVVKKARILAISLVTTPAEPKAKVSVKETKNLITKGFTPRKGINKLFKKQ